MTSKQSILIICLTILVTVTLSAMPPSPELYESLKAEGKLGEVSEMFRQARINMGVNQPFDFDPNQFRRDDEDQTVLKVLCLLADFDDNEANEDQFSAEHFQEMLFSEAEYATGSMRDLYLENSYGEVDIIGDVFGWYRLENDYEYYVDSRNGFGQFPRNAAGLVRDLLTMANEDVDYSDYDNDEDGMVEGLFIVHAGSGAEANNGDLTMIWSHAAPVQPRQLRFDNVYFGRYAMEPEDGRIGVFGHELGHSMFGLPDLYDTGYNSHGIGRWSMMAGGSWGGGGNRPAHFDPWCKMVIGFLEPFSIVHNEEDIELLPVEEEPDVLVAWKHGEWNNEYFLIENRQSIGFDRSLPGDGLLIWHIDENMNSNANPWWPDKGTYVHNIVALEQADGNYGLEKNTSSGDRGDPFPGSTDNTIFGVDTEPDSKDYNGRETEVLVYNIEYGEDDNMLFDIAVWDGAGPEALSLLFVTRIPEEHVYPHPDDPDQEEMTDEVTLLRDIFHTIGAVIDSSSNEFPEDLTNYNVIFYVESWRDDEIEQDSLTFEEQKQLVSYLDSGGHLALIGPDIATNLQSGDNPLWDYLHAVYTGEGEPSDSGNIRILRSPADGYIGGMNLPFRNTGPCDHYTDIVGPDSLAKELFVDQNVEPRGLALVSDRGYRIILQPFLTGGIRDWGGSKERLIEKYFRHFRFYLERRSVFASPVVPETQKLLQTWPNPFNGSLNIAYSGIHSDHQIEIYDISGRRVGILYLKESDRIQTWKPEGMPSGNYILVPSDVTINPVSVTFIR